MQVLYGWTLGVIEAVCLTLVSGFSGKSLPLSTAVCATVSFILVGMWRASTFVVCFAVDYIVHYGLSYIECHEDGTFNLGAGRQNRVRFAFFEMGISVIGGSITTIGASLFLFQCQLTFFAQFGRFMCTTIVISIVYANTVYMALLAIYGPEGNDGMLCAPASAPSTAQVADVRVADETGRAGVKKDESLAESAVRKAGDAEDEQWR